MSGIYKAYDIRGVYGDTLTEDIAFKIGRAFATFLGSKKVIVGRDMRPHSKPLFEALAKGLTMQGANVISLGMCSTPMSNFANGLLKGDGAIMITASHNPGEWNGFKLSRGQAVPISGSSGIGDIEQIVARGSFAPAAKKPGKISEYDILPEYKKHVAKLAGGKPLKIKVAADMANAMGIYEAKALEGLVDLDPMFDTLDGTFPNHEANPLKHETLEALQKKLRSGKYAFGVAFDGDADRAGFLDEKGDIIPNDITTAVIAQDILQREKGIVLYDLRSSWSVKEVIEEMGGRAMMCRVGHAFIKQQMRDNKAIFAGELSGHYYFRDNYYTETSAMAVLCLASIISRTGKKLSEIVAPIIRYSASGEINSKVADTNKVLERIKAKHNDGRMINLDGISVEYKDWWFNVRGSNTEPLVRLNLEAKSKKLMEQKRDELLKEIRG